MAPKNNDLHCDPCCWGAASTERRRIRQQRRRRRGHHARARLSRSAERLAGAANVLRRQLHAVLRVSLGLHARLRRQHDPLRPGAQPSRHRKRPLLLHRHMRALGCSQAMQSRYAPPRPMPCLPTCCRALWMRSACCGPAVAARLPSRRLRPSRHAHKGTASTMATCGATGPGSP